jgi:hypothetical protein
VRKIDSSSHFAFVKTKKVAFRPKITAGQGLGKAFGSESHEIWKNEHIFTLINNSNVSKCFCDCFYMS